MKNLILIGLGLIALSSCQKRECWQCYVKYRSASFYPNAPYTYGDTTERCGWTEADMSAWVESQYYVGQVNNGYPPIRQGSCFQK